MRIGFDMLAVQSPHHGARGIGRVGTNLVEALLARDDDHEYVLYVHDDLPTERVPVTPRASLRTIRPRWELGEVMNPFMDRLVATNPDGLDTFVVLSPFEKWANYSPPSRPPDGPKMVALVHDLIPFLFQNENVVDPVLMRHFHVLETIKRYDTLLAVSTSTQRDLVSVLGIPPEKAPVVHEASNGRFFRPDRTRPVPVAVRETLTGLGIDRPFIFNVGGLDPRKNTWKLIEAYAGLPDPIRARHQLVLTFAIDHWGREAVRDHARRCGVEDSVVVTGEISDDALLILYQRCAAFVFPSLYEGWGLPLLEAMHCGAVVLAGNNSSQVEVVGDGGLLVDAGDEHDLSAKMATALVDRDLASSLRTRAVAQAARFSWESTATKVVNALTAVEGRPRKASRLRFDRGHARKPTIAFFSPLPPRKSGVSDYSASLLDGLRKTYTIDLFHDAGYLPEPALASGEFMTCDYRLFDRLAAAKNYHAIVYQMGNSRYHTYMYQAMRKHRGLVTLHDFCLAGFHLIYGRTRGDARGFIAGELMRWYPDDGPAIERAMADWPESWDEIARDCARRGWYLNRSVLDAAELMVVHSPWCEAQVRASSPELSDKVVVIPLGSDPRRMTEAERAAVRQRFNLPPDALVVASFGFVHPDKMSPQALDAFAEVTRVDPGALFVFVGEEADGGEVRRHAASLGLSDRVRFLGRQPLDAFADLVTVTDVGVNLRLPPTNGETSAALLNLLASGVPTVVTDVATFSDFPASVVRKVRWETDGPGGLLKAIYGLCTDRAAREALGQAAWMHVHEYHDWARVTRLYVDAIERCHEARAAGRVASRPARIGVEDGRPVIALGA